MTDKVHSTRIDGKTVIFLPWLKDQIKEVLREGNGIIAKSTRRSGKTTAILELMQEMGTAQTALIVATRELRDGTARLWMDIFPRERVRFGLGGVCVEPLILTQYEAKAGLLGMKCKVFIDELQLIEEMPDEYFAATASYRE